MKETAADLGVTYSALQAAVFHGRIAEPTMRVGSHKLFNEKEIDDARKYFDARRKKRGTNDNAIWKA